MANPGMPNADPGPSGPLPGDLPQPPGPDDLPDIGPTGPRSPIPVDDPGVTDPKGPGSEPDYLPGGPTDPGIRM